MKTTGVDDEEKAEKWCEVQWRRMEGKNRLWVTWGSGRLNSRVERLVGGVEGEWKVMWRRNGR